MLIQFSVENYLSIKEKVTFSLLASNDKEHPGHLISSDKRANYLKSAVIYGANASGKSNILNAFWFMVDYVLTSHERQLNKLTGRVPFKFSEQTFLDPSRFEVIFTVNGIRYDYGFSVTEKEITEEYLYHYPLGRPALIFERKHTDQYRFTSDIDLQNSLKDRNSPNKLYLSTAANWNYDKVKPAFQWFASCIVLCKYSSLDNFILDFTKLRNEVYCSQIVEMLQIADLGIKSLQIKNPDEVVDYGLDSLFSENHRNYRNRVDAVHQVSDDHGNLSTYKLRMDEESDGTNSYFKLVGLIKDTLESGGLLIADEIDAHLHPLLTKHIVSLFNSAEQNPNGAQLIFTSHNTNLLDLDILRRDQIWFTEKDDKTAITDLFSLYDFSVRKDAKIEKNYLIGRYAAIPFIKGGIL